jgi:RNA polymerase sigma-70 factor (ECF subfamily)
MPPHDRASFGEIYRDHAPAVFRCLLAWSRDHALAEDLLAETFVHALAAEQPVRAATARGYLLAIARNLWREHGRRQWRQQPLQSASVDADPDKAILLERTLQALAALPENLREPLVLYAQGELSYEEISAALHISIATVKVRIFRARQKLEQYR